MLTSLLAAIAVTASGATPVAAPPKTGLIPRVIYRGDRVQLALPAGWRYEVPVASAIGGTLGPGSHNLMEATSGDGSRVSIHARCEHTEAVGDFGWTLVPDASGFGVERIEERPWCKGSEAECLAGIEDGPEAEEARQWCCACALVAGQLGIEAYFPGDGEAIKEVCLSLGNDKRKDSDREPLRRIAMSLKVLSPADQVATSAVRLGLEKPEMARAWRLGRTPGVKPAVTAIRNCLVYGAYAVLWTDDGYLGGVSGLEVRARPVGVKPSEACADAFSGKRLLNGEPAPITGGSPKGVLGKWLMLDSVTCNNVSCGLGVVDLSSGKKVLDVSLKSDLGMAFARSAAGITATYWESMADLPCVPRRGEAECWASIRAQVGSPSFAKLRQPDCESSVKRSGADTPARAFVVTVHVRRHLPGGEVEYLPSQPHCDDLD